MNTTRSFTWSIFWRFLSQIITQHYDKWDTFSLFIVNLHDRYAARARPVFDIIDHLPLVSLTYILYKGKLEYYPFQSLIFFSYYSKIILHNETLCFLWDRTHNISFSVLWNKKPICIFRRIQTKLFYVFWYFQFVLNRIHCALYCLLVTIIYIIPVVHIIPINVYLCKFVLRNADKNRFLLNVRKYYPITYCLSNMSRVYKATHELSIISISILKTSHNYTSMYKLDYVISIHIIIKNPLLYKSK